MSYPSYPEYRDSDIDWLGNIPTQWGISRLPFISLSDNAGEVIDKSYWGDGHELLYTCATEPFPANFQDFPDIKRTKENDILVTRNGTPYVHEPKLGSIYTNVVQRIALKNSVHKRYIKYTLEVAAKSLVGIGVSIASFGYEMWTSLRFPLPPESEQTQIARFLDHQTARIDALIAEQQRLIELLKEKRQAVISHAVTKGLDPDVVMKDSGVEWLGEVPEHWIVCLLKRNFESADYGISDSLEVDGAIPVLRMGNISEGKVVSDNLKYTDSVPSELLLKPGDLLFNRTNSLDLIGKVGLYEGDPKGPTSFASYLVRLRLLNHSSPHYFSYLLNTPNILGIAQANALVAIGQCNLNPARYGEITVAVPPLEEQDQISEYLDSKVTTFDSLISNARKGIYLLKERRSALISAAVTGKIDIRDWEPPSSEAFAGASVAEGATA